MNVYVIEESHQYDGNWIVEIFSTKKLAEKYVEQKDNDDFIITEWEVKGELE